MQALLALVMGTAALGIDVGWQPAEEGGLEYIIQIEPDLAARLKPGDEIVGGVRPTLHDVRRYRIVIGNETLPRNDQTEHSVLIPPRAAGPVVVQQTVPQGSSLAATPPMSSAPANRLSSGSTLTAPAKDGWIAGPAIPSVPRREVAVPPNSPEKTDRFANSANGIPDAKPQPASNTVGGAWEAITSKSAGIERPFVQSLTAITEPPGAIKSLREESFHKEFQYSLSTAAVATSTEPKRAVAGGYPSSTPTNSPAWASSPAASGRAIPSFTPVTNVPIPVPPASVVGNRTSTIESQRPARLPMDPAVRPVSTEFPMSDRYSNRPLGPVENRPAAGSTASAPVGLAKDKPAVGQLPAVAAPQPAVSGPALSTPATSAPVASGTVPSGTVPSATATSAAPQRPWLGLTITLFALFASIGGNVFLGWIAHDSRSRYRQHLEESRLSAAA